MVSKKFEIPVGTRFKLSKLGEARNPRLKRGAEGTQSPRRNRRPQNAAIDAPRLYRADHSRRGVTATEHSNSRTSRHCIPWEKPAWSENHCFSR